MISLLRLLPAMLLAGCAAAPAGPGFTMHRGDRIGLLVESGDRPMHTHYQPEGGNSIRSARSYPYDWRLDAAVSETVDRQLTLAGFTVIDLESRGLRHADLAGLVQQSGSRWLPAADSVMAQLREQGVRAVVLIKDARAIADRDCSGGPCERVAEGPGLYSTTAGRITTWRAVAAFDWHVYLLDPPGDLAAAQPLRSTLEIPSVPLFGFAQPRDPAALTEAELGPVREKVLEYVEAAAEDVVLVLGGGRVVEQGARATPAAAPVVEGGRLGR